MFNEGGYETFIPLVFKLIGKVRRRYRRSRAKPRVDPHEAAQTPVDEMTRHAYVTLLALCTMKLYDLIQFLFWLILQLCRPERSYIYLLAAA